MSSNSKHNRVFAISCLLMSCYKRTPLGYLRSYAVAVLETFGAFAVVIRAQIRFFHAVDWFPGGLPVHKNLRLAVDDALL